MARIRSIRPEFWDSQKVGGLSILSRLTFIGLISLADDDGRGRGDARFLLARIHPYASDISIEDLQKSLDCISGVGLAVFYEADGSVYYELPGWKQHQKIERPNKSLLPSNSVSTHRTLTDNSVSTRCGKGVEGSGLEGKGYAGLPDPMRRMYDVEFNAFMAAYPNKNAVDGAWKVWQSMNPSKELQAEFLKAIEKQKKKGVWTKGMVHEAKNWLADGRWEDVETEIVDRDRAEMERRTKEELTRRGYFDTKK